MVPHLGVLGRPWFSYATRVDTRRKHPAGLRTPLLWWHRPAVRPASRATGCRYPPRRGAPRPASTRRRPSHSPPAPPCLLPPDRPPPPHHPSPFPPPPPSPP